jgi:hypothetical protein
MIGVTLGKENRHGLRHAGSNRNPAKEFFDVETEQ